MNLLPPVVLGAFLQAASAATAGPFPGLKSIQVDDLGPAKVMVLYNERIGSALPKPPSRKKGDCVAVLRTALRPDSTAQFRVEYDPGRGAEPAFVIYSLSRGDASEAGRIPGMRLYIPGNGALYSSGHASSMFDQRRKFTVYGGKLAEVRQPFYFVGLESRALMDLDLLSAKGSRSAVVRVPRGDPVTVLLNDGEWYLLKTSFGLLGWYKLQVESQFAAEIEGLFFAGE
jgi:hypothetical protein